MDSLLQDLRFAARSLRKNVGFTFVAMATLALGIGASTAIFTIVDTVLLRPLEYPDPDRLVSVLEVSPTGVGPGATSPANFADWRERSPSFSDLAAMYDRPQNLTSPGAAAEVLARLTTGNFFSMLGVNAQLGRIYREGDDPDAVAVISHGLWQRRFTGDVGIVGRTLTINDRVRTIVGVMPASFRSIGARPDVWLPIRLDPDWYGRFLTVTGRLRPGTPLERARAEMTALARQLEAVAPQFNTNWTIRVDPLHERVTGNVRHALFVLLGAVGLLLLITCANVANLLLGRATARRAEIAVRLSLGATRARIVRQVLTESLLLAFSAGVLGVILAMWGTDALARLVPAELALPRLDEVSVDARVLAFVCATSFLTAMLFGIAPALVGSAVHLAQETREGSTGGGSGRTRLRNALVVAEVALAVVLLVGAGLLGRSLQQLLQVDTGLRSDSVLTMRLTLAASKYEQESELRAFMSRVIMRLQALPGAAAVGAETYLPLTGHKIGHGFTRDDRPEPAPGEELTTDIRVIAGDYFSAMGIPLLRGRGFSELDHEGAPAAFVVNEALARRYFPDRDPVGQRISFDWDGAVSGEIVGVVGSIREMGPREEPSPAIYRSFAQMPMPQMILVVRTHGDPLALASPAAVALREIDPSQPVADVRTMEQVVSDTMARPRLILYVLGGFAGAALLLAAIGLYGIVSYSVSQRRQEIGVRIALGAQSGDVVGPILRQGLLLSALGLAFGLAGALASTRVMHSLLFGVGAADPLTLGAVAAFLVMVALAASYVPARRAARLDPSITLRAE